MEEAENPKKSRQNQTTMKTIKTVLITLLLTTVLESCREKEKPLDVTPFTVNPAFEMNPPIPKGVFIRLWSILKLS
jgi:hypothetical protein